MGTPQNTSRQEAIAQALCHGELFSPYFLAVGIEETPAWQALAGQEKRLRQVYAAFQEGMNYMRALVNPDEATTEDRLIRPFLEQLGYTYVRQKSVGQRRMDVPDFVLFNSEEDARAFEQAETGKRPWTRAAALLEAKAWGRLLDKAALATGSHAIV